MVCRWSHNIFSILYNLDGAQIFSALCFCDNMLSMGNFIVLYLCELSVSQVTLFYLHELPVSQVSDFRLTRSNEHFSLSCASFIFNKVRICECGWLRKYMATYRILK
jgi:hypothetical protein